MHVLNSGNTSRIDGFSLKSDDIRNYKEHKDMLKLFNKYGKAPLVNVLKKEGFHQGSATYGIVVSYLYKLQTDNIYSYHK